jgi:hypothetical protein
LNEIESNINVVISYLTIKATLNETYFPLPRRIAEDPSAIKHIVLTWF